MMQSNISVESFKELYNTLNRDTLSLEKLATVYHNDIMFEDCFHSIHGIALMHDYFDNLYENVSSISFEFEDEWADDHSAMLTWTMSYQHPKLNSGNTIRVKGASRLTFKDNKVIGHRDYFDGGALLYEHIPLLKRVIHFLKNRLA